MRIRRLHSWDLSPKDAVALQRDLAGRIERRGARPDLRWIAGADISFDKHSPVGYAGVVLLDARTLEIEHSFTHTGRLRFPYVPGLLSFREAPLLLELFARVKPRPQLVFFDGQGIAHPRRLGLASHLGLFLDCPTIGCAKTVLTGEYDDPGTEKGDRAPLRAPDGEVLGMMLRTRRHCRPIAVSIGHRIDLETAVAWTLRATTRYRIPEPTRQAHLLVNRIRREQV